MMPNGESPGPEAEEFRAIVQELLQNELLPMLDKHNTEFIENRIAMAVKSFEAQLQPIFDKVGKRFEALEKATAPVTVSNNGVKEETVGDRVSSFALVGGALVDKITDAVTKFIPVWQSLQAVRYSYGLTAEQVAKIRETDPIRAITLAQMLNPDPMLAQLPSYTYNILAMGTQAGLRMRQAISGGGSFQPDGSPSSTSGPGSSTPGLMPRSGPSQMMPRGVSMNASDEQQLISVALKLVGRPKGQGRSRR